MGQRFFHHGELHLVVLVLLSERSLHGYELMSELARLFGPAYRPSPGSVYPAVKSLAGEGLIAAEPGQEPTRYRTTRSGEQAVATRRDDLSALELRTGVQLGDAEGVEEILQRFGARIRRLRGHIDPSRLEERLDALAVELEDHHPHLQED
ncbi:MAG: PadR family transcriptional regulator [Nitriliruptor sp.]|uniref:helix-turn-helix transcriptional regulator n=1 Tax=Nitriliruptor sp. TaxID=2448056 RepID=UPI0034A05528